VTLGNHDSRRSLSKFGCPDQYQRESAALLATWLLTLPATPFLFQGEELALTDVRFPTIEDYRDIQTLNRFSVYRAQGDSEYDALRKVQSDSRDNGRTPIPWTSNRFGGFSTKTPWIKMPREHKLRNAAAALRDGDSVFHAYRELIALRRQHPVLVRGDFECLSFPPNPVVCYIRRLAGERCLLIVLNWQDAGADFPEVASDCQSLVWRNQNQAVEPRGKLLPWEARILAGEQVDSRSQTELPAGQESNSGILSALSAAR
jgi:oligo-1,6-glucosidase